MLNALTRGLSEESGGRSRTLKTASRNLDRLMSHNNVQFLINVDKAEVETARGGIPVKGKQLCAISVVLKGERRPGGRILKQQKEGEKDIKAP